MPSSEENEPSRFTEDDQELLFLNDQIPLNVLRENINSQSLSAFYNDILEVLLNEFISELQLNSRHVGSLEDWSTCYKSGKRYCEISLLVLPHHGYYSSKLYRKERSRNFVLTYLLTDVLLNTVVERIIEYNTILNLASSNMMHKNGDTADEAQYLYNVARLSPNFVAVRDGEFRNSSAWDSCDTTAMVDQLGCLRGNLVADGMYDYLLTLCQSNSSNLIEHEEEDDKEGLEKYMTLRDDMLARARIDLADDPIYVSLCKCIDKVQQKKGRKSSIKPIDNNANPYSDLVAVKTRAMQHSRRSLSSSSLSLALGGGSRRDIISPESVINENEESNLLTEALWQFALEDFETSICNGDIEVRYLNTYQGKNVDEKTGLSSQNGCTVIAPMIAAKHVGDSTYPGINDEDVAFIMDIEAPKKLNMIRSKLALPEDALIIPSDSHDHLMDDGLLTEKMFAGVCGGNILDDNHLNEFFEMIEGKEEGVLKKAASAFFFCEHVISVLKMVSPVGDNKIWYELIDSMPYMVGDTDDPETDVALRIKCNTSHSLEIALKWYLLSKLTEEDMEFIDNNEWCEQRFAVDPRVFQAFLWMDTAVLL